MKLRLPALLAGPAVLLALTGCGGSTTVTGPTIQPAATYRLVDLKPSGPIVPGKPVRVSFSIQQPDGTPLTEFKRGPGPHTGIHMILVRHDLAYIIHKHPPAGKATISQVVTFPAPGPYRLVIDVYPKSVSTQVNTNFQLFGEMNVAGAYKPKPLPPPSTTQKVDGYTFKLHGAQNLKALEAKLVTVDVTTPEGKPAEFTPWYGALAHAIFFRQSSLDYFHTHVCAPGVTGCTSIVGPARIAGTSSTPGKLRVGMLFSAPGTWQLFLQLKQGRKILTVPFTLHVR